RFQIDRIRVLAGGDEVFLVDIDALERIRQAQQGAAAPVVSACVALVSAGARFDELDPAVRGARQHAQRRQRVREPLSVQPLDEREERGVEPEILWLVDEPEAVAELKAQHRAAAVVTVGLAWQDANERAERRPIERSRDLRAIGREMLEELSRP